MVVLNSYLSLNTKEEKKKKKEWKLLSCLSEERPSMVHILGVHLTDLGHHHSISFEVCGSHI